MRILIADDDDAIRRLLALETRAAGHTVFEADDGEQAFQLCMELRPDAVFLDVLMPKMNGFTTLAKLRDEGYSGKAIIITALTTDSSNELQEGVAPDGILYKPFRRREVHACLEKLQATVKGG